MHLKITYSSFTVFFQGSGLCKPVMGPGNVTGRGGMHGQLFELRGLQLEIYPESRNLGRC